MIINNGIVNPYTITQVNSMYAITYNEINNLTSFLQNDTFLNDLDLLFRTPSDYIVSLRAYPFDTRAFFSNVLNESGEIQVGKVIDTGINGFQLSSKLGSKLITSHYFSPFFNSFLDYSPYTTLEIYLPYIDKVEVNVNEIIGYICYFYFAVDFNNGQCMWYLLRNREKGLVEYDESQRVLIGSWRGTCGVEIGIGSTNANEVAKNTLFSVIGASANSLGTYSTILDKIGPGAMGYFADVRHQLPHILDTSVNLIKGAQIKTTTTTSGVGSLNFTSPQDIILCWSRPNVISIYNYDYLYGKPLCENKVLNTLQGFTVIETFKLVGFKNATETEKDMVSDLFTTGIIL